MTKGAEQRRFPRRKVNLAFDLIVEERQFLLS